MDLTPKQQTSEAIRQAETILIMTGQHPSIDQVSAVVALAAILRKFGKKVSAVVSDSLAQSVSALDTGVIERNLSGMRDFVLKVDVTKAEVDKLRYEVADGKLQIFLTPFKGGFAPSDVTFDYGQASFQYDLAIVLGVPTRARIDRAYDQNAALFEQIPLVNLDFHRSNEGYGAVNLIEPTASSLCEMLVALSESLQGGIIDAEIATALLMGIMGSTDRFTASHTTSKSLTVAAQMMAAGARQQAVVKALYREGRGERSGGSDQNKERGERSRGERDGRDNRDNGERNQPSRDNREGQRSEQRGEARTEQPRAEQSRPAEQPRTEQPRTEQARPAEQPHQAEPATAAPVVVAAPVAAPAAQAPFMPYAEASAIDDMPIIAPGHIELSQPTVAPVSFEDNPTIETLPLADFAAASEVLHQPDTATDNHPGQ